ncbi:MAG: bifunctional methylenetetrahydrofolate dehydrogenase/methenyltetrahydrofolate cyclohydrolase FolD [Verrucomicrobia bacterium]|nr:bifunctional methylenetetrahydrofolate dehydrogenase/methenyltetrahydrofolate cyclohydrolase FolD [Verrucomicrobiota bacterium]
MTAKIIDGKKIAAELRTELRQEAARLKAAGMPPGLGVILVGDDPASRSYVTAKERACAEIGIYSSDNRLPADTTEDALLALIARLNADSRIHGILLQLPLPPQMDEGRILLAIAPEKDVDGFHPSSVGLMMLGRKTFLPCTPHGIVQLLARSGVNTVGQHVVVIGRSNIVGKPVANMLCQKSPTANATVTLCHSATMDLAHFTRQADILIVATGRPNTVTADMIKEGAVIIDVGVNRVVDAARTSGYRLVGDVDFDGVLSRASLITPVPGGVGPMTITMLLHNTVQAARDALTRRA